MTYKVTTAPLEDESTDVLILWVFEDLKSGPEPFADVVKRASSQAYYSLYTLKEYLNPSDCITTIGGGVKANILCFSVYPINEAKFQDSIFNIRETLNTYSKQNLCRFVSLSLPTYKNLDKIISYLDTYFQNFEPLRELRIFCKTDIEKGLIEKSLKKVIKQRTKKPWYKRIFA